ncbi:MAG: hypothetical protein J6U54_07585 [Clostridiales bacterium]|nr:hypothetical protein [Clostridiales bacterium]
MIFRRKVEDKVAERVATKVFEDFSQKHCGKQLKTSTIKDIINNPDDYELLARVEDGEVVIRIRKPKKEAKQIKFHSENPMICDSDGNLYFKS